MRLGFSSELSLCFGSILRPVLTGILRSRDFYTLHQKDTKTDVQACPVGPIHSIAHGDGGSKPKHERPVHGRSYGKRLAPGTAQCSNIRTTGLAL